MAAVEWQKDPGNVQGSPIEKEGRVGEGFLHTYGYVL